jgi:hypothetical protein
VLPPKIKSYHDVIECDHVDVATERKNIPVLAASYGECARYFGSNLIHNDHQGNAKTHVADQLIAF